MPEPKLVEAVARAIRCHECGDVLTPEEVLHYETLCEACETAIHEECALAAPDEGEEL